MPICVRTVFLSGPDQTAMEFSIHNAKGTVNVAHNLSRFPYNMEKRVNVPFFSKEQCVPRPLEQFTLDDGIAPAIFRLRNHANRFLPLFSKTNGSTHNTTVCHVCPEGGLESLIRLFKR